MPEPKMIMCDGNTAASSMAYAFSEVAAIYPITPSSDMGENADAWAAQGRLNLFGQPVQVVQMQSEAGAAGACHGALSGGALVTTFTASQGLLLMIPNMFKIAGELQPAVFHVSARSVACQALSIFGDHSDVMAARSTGFGLISSANVQEAQDLGAIAHLASLESRVPFVHFFDGFRTSHSIQKITPVSYDTLGELLEMTPVEAFRKDALNPERPVCKVGAQNPDVYFQGRETVNPFYDKLPGIVGRQMDRYAKATGRSYGLFEYVGAPDATKVLVSMGTSCETIEETVNYLVKQGEKVGAIKVRLYRPWDGEAFAKALPESVQRIAVLDRTKEPGAPGEPLFLDIVSTLAGKDIRVIGGRYGLSSKEFTPGMVKAVYDHLAGECRHGFTVGINDDVTNLSIPVGEDLDTEPEGTIRCKFWGYGSDGTVSACKNSIKIIGEGTDLYAQGYFQYDSNKSGGFTVSHLRFGKQPIQSEYLLKHCDFIALHRSQYIGRYDLLEGIVEGGTFLVNMGGKSPDAIFKKFTPELQETIKAKNVKVFAIDASKLAKEVGLGGRINTIMQTAFFKLSGVLPEDDAINLIKKHVEKQFARKGQEIVEMNWRAIDAAVDAIMPIPVPGEDVGSAKARPVIPEDADEFAREVVEPVIRLKGDTVPVSRMPINGAIPTMTRRLENRGRPGAATAWMEGHELVPEGQFDEPYFEYPGSCEGCGEISYLYVATQLFGDRMIIANATGCSSIYGGTFPVIPYAKDSNGRGPAWANSLFEDNAEYGFGMRLAVDANRARLREILRAVQRQPIDGPLADALKKMLACWSQTNKEAKGAAEALRAAVADASTSAEGELAGLLRQVRELEDWLIDKSIWAVGGDGWAYDIGFGGLDHVMAQNHNINALVLDTEVYSNTGGQSSKATPRGAVAKFAASGKKVSKKNLGLMITTYGSAYVASINMSLNRDHALRAIVEAEAYPGPSLVIAYSPCIAHGYSLADGPKHSVAAGETGYWPLYRYNPALLAQGQNPFSWDSEAPIEEFQALTSQETRYKALHLSDPEEAQRLYELAVDDNKRRFESLKTLADTWSGGEDR